MHKFASSHFNSIKYKFLFSTFLFVIIFTIIIIYFWYSTTKKDAEVSATTYTSEMLKVSNENLEVALKDIHSIISLLSINSTDEYNVSEILTKGDNISELEEYKDSIKISDLLTKLANNKYYLNGITISNLKGKYFSTGIATPYESLKEQPWYDKIIKSHGEKIFIPPHFYDKYNANTSQSGYKDMVFSYAKAIIDEGAVIGFVIADIRCEILTDIFNRNIKDKGYIYIADSNLNELIYNPPANNITLFNNKSELIKILNKANKSEGSFYIDAAGQSVLIVYTKSVFTGWVTIGAIPVSNLLSNFYKARNNVFLLTIVFCIFAFTVLFMICTVLTKNILRLNKAVSKINKDNLEFNVNITSNDEVGHLYQQMSSMVDRIKRLIIDIKKVEKEKVTAEIKFLQSQINPHFLYNTLNTIKFISSLHGVDSIKKISESLSTLLHVNMDQRVFISISEEVEYIRSYLGIQEFKYNNILYNIIVEENTENLMTLKLLLQPIVENALIHGLSVREGQGIINIKIYKDSDTLKIRIQDNGTGMDEETIANILEDRIQSRGIGLNNIISRIKMYFGDCYGISIVSQPNLFTIMEISVPVISEDEVKNFA